MTGNAKQHGENPYNYYATVIDSVGDGVIVVDKNGIITLFNPAAEEITGFSSRQAAGLAFEKLFSVEKPLLDMLEKTKLTGITITDHENIVVRSSGKIRPVAATCYPLMLDSGENIGTVLTLRDITYVRELEAAIRQADRLSTIGILAAGLAHEIKNPLGGIKGTAQLLEQELATIASEKAVSTDGDNLSDYTRVMIREVERIDKIIHELLELTSPRKLSFSPVNLHKVIGDILLFQKQSVAGRNIIFIKNFDLSIPAVMADEELLTRLFLNLICNAIEALPEKGELTVTSRILADYRMAQDMRRSRMVVLEIADNGSGIPKTDLENIWTPFFSSRAGGTGLGLTICHKIVSEHRGMIKVESEEGKGTKFTVLLPLVQ